MLAGERQGGEWEPVSRSLLDGELEFLAVQILSGGYEKYSFEK